MNQEARESTLATLVAAAAAVRESASAGKMGTSGHAFLVCRMIDAERAYFEAAHSNGQREEAK
jgi:hypothetical protein